MFIGKCKTATSIDRGGPHHSRSLRASSHLSSQERPQRLLVALECGSCCGFEVGIDELPIALTAHEPRLRDARLVPAIEVIELGAGQAFSIGAHWLIRAARTEPVVAPAPASPSPRDPVQLPLIRMLEIVRDRHEFKSIHEHKRAPEAAEGCPDLLPIKSIP
jgi:hypothetical protein